MYKVFINDKPLILTDQIPEKINQENVVLYHFKDHSDLKRLVQSYETDQSNKELIIINRNNFDLLHDAFVSIFTPIIAAGGIVYHPDKGMLWILRHNRWDLPKGKIDPYESTEEAAIREVEEETGLKNLEITHPLGMTLHAYREKKKFILKTSHWFKMHVPNPHTKLIPQVKESITKVEWAGQDSIAEKISDTYASLQGLAREFVIKYTLWKLR